MEGAEEQIDQDENLPEVRSINSDMVSYVRFKALAGRRVNLFWIDFEGNRVLYATLDPGEEFEIQTYVTHPWVFRDADTGILLHGNGQAIYMPEESDEVDDEEDIQYKLINIHIPVYSLLDRCVEAFSIYNPDIDIKEISLPQTLKMEIATHIMNKNLDYSFWEDYGQYS